jgi:L,D-peptidoglycan transpeptidase YkuD (ErfK/YbiS/YcfS/YnhG family)
MEKVREILVYSDGRIACGDMVFKCALGKGGVVEDKIEGDGGTPLGTFPIRKVFYRSDRVRSIVTDLELSEITRDMGWCDDVSKDEYNKEVKLPFEGKHEEMYRDDHVYDVVCVLGYNDEPVVKGKGSAVFMHLSRENYTPTEGCVALSLEDMTTLLSRVSRDTVVTILRAQCIPQVFCHRIFLP